MDDLRIEDSDGDAFRLTEAAAGRAVLESDDAVNIAHTDAVRMIDWLRERFGLEQELTAIGLDPGLEIAVETETGKTRNVRWYGSDVPAALVELAGIALRVYDRGADPAPIVRIGVTTGIHECGYLTTVTDLLEVMQGTGVRSTSGTLVNDVRDLVNLQQRGEVPIRQNARGLLQELGVDTFREALDRVKAEHGRTDKATTVLLALLGREPSDEGHDLVDLIAAVKAKHHAALTNQMAGAQTTLNQAVASHRSVLQRQATQHDEFRRSVPMQIESALSTERNARAAVQAELDEKRKENLQLRRQFNDSEERGRAAREALELAEDTQRELLGKLEKAREGLRSVGAKITADAGPEDELAQSLLSIVFEELERDA